MFMKDAKIKIITFNSYDVIATSGEGEQTTTDMIWISAISAQNFNTMKSADVNPLFIEEGYDYLSYTGKNFFGYWINQDYQNEIPSPIFATISSTSDTANYNKVLNWLDQNKK